MPEIDAKRQEELAQRRQITPDIDKGIYPFKRMKLSRADVEWLLASTHGSRGGEENDWRRPGPPGLDVRGADLRQVDLNLLPLARLRAGLNYDERQARQRSGDNGERKSAALRLNEYQAAVRANRKLAVALQGQGLNEEAARFAYQAQQLQRVVLRSRNKYGQYLLSWTGLFPWSGRHALPA